jgi:predicted nucleotidyltransferase
MRRSLLGRYDRLLDELVTGLRARYGSRLVAVAVFGSVGRGTFREDSDVDLLIVADGLPSGRFRRIDEFEPVEASLDPVLRAAGSGGSAVALSPVFKTREEVKRGSPLFLDMVEDARILHDPDGFLMRYLADLRARLRELGARRIWSGNAWYWELKPDLTPGEVIRL